MTSNAPILIAFGTRPEEIKISPLLNQGLNLKLLFTGQHEHLLENNKFDFRIKPTEGTNRLDQIITDCLTQFPEERFQAVLVQGDTASAHLAVPLPPSIVKHPLFTSKLDCAVLTWIIPTQRKGIVSWFPVIAALNLCPTESSKQNLLDEKVPGRIEVTGNTLCSTTSIPSRNVKRMAIMY